MSGGPRLKGGFEGARRARGFFASAHGHLRRHARDDGAAGGATAARPPGGRGSGGSGSSCVELLELLYEDARRAKQREAEVVHNGAVDASLCAQLRAREAPGNPVQAEEAPHDAAAAAVDGQGRRAAGAPRDLAGGKGPR